MSPFVERLDALIEAEFGNRARFAEASGASTAYLSEIFNKGKLPTVVKLREWLKKAGISPISTTELVLLCSKEKAMEEPDLKPWLVQLDKQHTEAKAALSTLMQLCLDHGLKIPEEIQERIRAM